MLRIAHRKIRVTKDALQSSDEYLKSCFPEYVSDNNVKEKKKPLPKKRVKEKLRAGFNDFDNKHFFYAG